MSNFLDLKLKAYDDITVNNAVNHLATMLLHYSKAFDFDNASYADARTVALGILMEAKELCEDEGCPRAGTVHVCIPKGEPVPNKDADDNPIPHEVSPSYTEYVQQVGRGMRVPQSATNDQIAAVMLMKGDKGQVAEALAYSRGMLTRPDGVKLTDGSYERGDGSIAWPEPGEHSEVLAAIEAHNTGEEE